MTLVDDAKGCWKWFSMQAMTLAGTVQGVWVTLPEDMRAQVPSNFVYIVTIALLVAGIAGRLVKQDADK